MMTTEELIKQMLIMSMTQLIMKLFITTLKIENDYQNVNEEIEQDSVNKDQ